MGKRKNNQHKKPKTQEPKQYKHTTEEQPSPPPSPEQSGDAGPSSTSMQQPGDNNGPSASLQDVREQVADKTISGGSVDDPRDEVLEPEQEEMAATKVNMLKNAPTGHNVTPLPDFAAHKLEAPDGHAVRPGFATSQYTVFSNHLRLNLVKEKKAYIYEVDGIDNDWTKPKKRVLMERFMRTCKLLDDFTRADGFLITDHHNRIVALQDLSALSENGPVEPGSTTPLVEVSVPNHNPKARTAEALSLRLNYKSVVCLDDFIKYCNAEIASIPSGDLGFVINLLIGKVMDDHSKIPIFRVGTNKVYAMAGWTDLEYRDARKLAIRGYRFGIQPGMRTPLLNVNPITTVFHKSMKVSDYIMKNGQVHDELKDHLKGVRVYLTLDRGVKELDQPARRIKTIARFGDFADMQYAYTDEENGTEYTVWDHMKHWYLNCTKLYGTKKSTCVNLGGENGKEQWFLAEDLQILPYQPFRGDSTSLTSDIVKVACKTPQENLNLIQAEFVRFLDMDISDGRKGHKLLSKNGDPIDLYHEPQLIQAHNAAQTRIRYQGTQRTDSDFGKWDLYQQQFLSVGNRFSGHAHFLIPRFLDRGIDEDTRSRYLKFFHQQYSANGATGLGTFQKIQPSNSTYVTRDQFNVDRLTKFINQAKANGAGLIILILPAKKKTQLLNYAKFKIAADQRVGMKSLCLCEEKIINTFKVKEGTRKVFKGLPDNVTERDAFSGYVRNVAMKLNVRLGNENHTAEDSVLQAQIPGFAKDQDLMILGADIVHPGQGTDENVPSIAAVVGTIDKNFASYRGSARRQTHCEEVIEDMKSMAKERLEAYAKVSGRLPARILYYRDGIDDKRWKEIRDTETGGIRQAWAELAQSSGDKVKITTVIVSKRHHIRFYPSKHDKQHEIPPSGKQPNGNCLPGTVVDSGVTLLWNWDFYLISHNAIKGTARPTHYIVLEDQIGFTPAQIQNLTNVLCSTYARSTTAVSYVPAAYYADHLCERAKQYLRPLYDNLLGPNANVAAEAQRMWGLGGRPNGNPWRKELDDTMFWI